MSPIALYEELQAQTSRFEITSTSISQNSRRSRLTAQWLKEDRKLICKWYVSE